MMKLRFDLALVLPMLLALTLNVAGCETPPAELDQTQDDSTTAATDPIDDPAHDDSPATQAHSDDASDLSVDPTYGYTSDKPVRLGLEDEFSGPRASRMFLEALRDANGRPIQFRREGSFGAGPDGNILDRYEIRTSTGEVVRIYIDMYHPDRHPLDQPAPKGMSISR